MMWLLPFIYLPGLNRIYSFLDENTERYWFDVLYYVYYHTLFIALLATLVFFGKLNWRSMYGKIEKTELWPSIKLTTFTFLFSIAAAYALFYPLSYIYPNFVKWWYIDLPPLIYFGKGVFPLFPNILNFISLVILAPAIEEFAFRGILLHRWYYKWGMIKAILFSSLLFGIAHPDPIGATAFGVAMCILYLKNKTLWIPIFCHALNNLTVWIIEAGYFISLGPSYIDTIEDFQKGWYVGVICAVIVSIWVYVYMKGSKSQKVWELPNI